MRQRNSNGSYSTATSDAVLVQRLQCYQERFQTCQKRIGAISRVNTMNYSNPTQSRNIFTSQPEGFTNATNGRLERPNTTNLAQQLCVLKSRHLKKLQEQLRLAASIQEGTQEQYRVYRYRLFV